MKTRGKNWNVHGNRKKETKVGKTPSPGIPERFPYSFGTRWLKARLNFVLRYLLWTKRDLGTNRARLSATVWEMSPRSAPNWDDWTRGSCRIFTSSNQRFSRLNRAGKENRRWNSRKPLKWNVLVWNVQHAIVDDNPTLVRWISGHLIGPK